MSELIIKNNMVISCNTRQEELIIPDGVINIGNGAFKGCTSIKKIVMPDTIEVIGANAFKGCRNLEYIELSSKLKEIGEYAFYRCHNIKKIILPFTVKKLGNCVFLYCDSLQYIEMPGVMEFGKQTFLNDINLEEIVISNNVKLDSIRDCFTGCNKIKRVKLAGKKKKYNESCNIEEKNYGKENISWNIEDKDYVIKNKSCNIKDKDYVIENKSCNIEDKDYAIENKSYDIENIVDILSGKEIVLPIIRTIVQDIYSILKIKDGVLVEYLNNVKNVELPEGITEIGKSCFYDKRGIQSVVFPRSLKKIGIGAFRGCISLEKVEFLTDEVYLEEAAFLNCSALHEIILPNKIKYELTGLKEISGNNVTKLVKKIHRQVLENFVISGTILIKYCGCETKVIVPDGITIIGQRAFARNEAIDRIELPDTVTYIEREAFADCVLLQSIKMSENLEEIEDAAFENCVKLIRINLGRAEIIPASCFKRCKVLQEVYVSDELRIIGELAFYGCIKLKLVKVLECPEKIGNKVFYKCAPLKEIEDMYFYKCAPLKEIGDMAFYGCSCLKEFRLLVPYEKIGKLAFTKSGIKQNLVIKENIAKMENVLKKEYIITKENLLEKNYKYENSGQESIYSRNVFAGSNLEKAGLLEIPEGTEYIEPYAYFSNEKITSVKLPESLKEIGEAAFYGCRNLKSIQFLNRNIILQKSCFEKCIALEEVNCTLKCVSQRAFAWCKNIKQIKLNGVKKICEEAFQGCMKLNQVKLDEVSFIGRNAFAMCDCLEEVVVGGEAFFDDFSFLDCGNLKSIVFHLSVNEISANEIPVSEKTVNEKPANEKLVNENYFMKSGAFRGCTSLERICISDVLNKDVMYSLSGYESLFDEKIPQFIKRMYASALSVFEIDADNTIISYDGFADKVTIPNGIRAIGREVFRDKENLKEVEIPESVEEIGARAFDKTEWLRQRIEENQMVVWKDILIDGTACKGKVVIPPYIRKIAGWAFANNMQMTRLQFTRRTQIEEFAFRNCIYLEEIILEDNTSYSLGKLSDIKRPQPRIVTQIIGECYNCFKMENDTLVECTGNIEQLKLPKGIKRIGKNVFKDSNLLTHLILNGEVTEIEEGAFMNCKWLQVIENAQSVVYIGKKAFSGCIRIKEIRGLKEELLTTQSLL